MPAPASIEEVAFKMRDIPESLRNFLSSADVMDALRELQKTYTLSEQASIETSRAIAWYVLGFVNARELAQELSRIAPQGKLADFRSDIIKKIFMPFSVQLHAHGLNFETIVSATVPEAVAQIKPSVAAAPVTTEPKSAPPLITPTIKPAPPTAVPPTAAPPPLPVIIEPPKPAAPPPVTEAPKPVISQVPAPTAAPKPPAPPISGPSRVIFAPQAPSAAPAPAGEIKKEEGPAFQPVRYTPAPVVPEVPKVISVPKPSGTPTIPPPPPPVKPSPQAVSEAIPAAATPTKKETIIDLSTFEVKSATKPEPSLPQNTPPSAEPGPKAKGNTLYLKP